MGGQGRVDEREGGHGGRVGVGVYSRLIPLLRFDSISISRKNAKKSGEKAAGEGDLGSDLRAEEQEQEQSGAEIH